MTRSNPGNAPTRSVSCPLLWVAVCCTWVAGCGDPPPAPEPNANPCACAPANTADALHDQAIPTGTRVAIDLSLSMAGFATASAASVEDVLISVKDALSVQGTGGMDFCELGDGLDPACGLPTEPHKYRDPRVYKAVHSQLSTALAPRKRAKTTSDNQPSTAKLGLLDDKAVTVLLTDGVESGANTTREDLEISCGMGAGAFCLRDVLVSRAKSGYGIWVVAMSLAFDGTLYAERGIDLVRFKDVQPHLDTVRARAGWDAVELKAELRRKQMGEKHDSYHYKGVRPLLAIVMTRDLPRGQAVAERLVQEVKAKPHALVPASRIELVQTAGFAPSALEWTTFVKTNKQPDNARELIARSTKPVPGVVAESFECHAAEGGDYLAGELKVKSAPAMRLPAQLAENVVIGSSVGPNGHESFLLPAAGSGQAGSYRVGANCRRLHGHGAWAKLTVSNGLVYQKSAQGWWHEWTSPDTWSQPERVFRLDELVDALLEQAQIPVKEQHCACIQLLAGKPE